MDVMTAIVNRKSVRTYTGEPLTKTQTEQLLTAAYASPVAMGRYEDLTLTVVQKPALLAAISEAAGNANILYGAPAFFVVSTPLTGTASDNMAYSNAATVVQNINLAAVALDLGACHIWGALQAFAKDPSLKTQLNIPTDRTPVAGLVVGVSSEDYPARTMPKGRIATTILE
ncbi:nitroreductase family protein [Lacticaseibacillus mingshuiensis]|uniref:Nitroreductase family protein n=1 Tax=Lacticaseibacillus mingshuiensis TaxID=2799574 RepID=A0ABW4CLK3_9LACO|nr:nitroreductase family protein [Lacticaseibacillus mingshuiensis]